MSKQKGKGSTGNPPEIPQEQWEMPATYSADGTHLLSLRDLTNPDVAALSLSQLTADQRAELVAERIEHQKEFEVVMIGAGMIDKRRAVAEVRAQSDVGCILIEVEQRVLKNLLNQVIQERSEQAE